MLKFTKFSTAAERSTENLISTLETESQAAKWSQLNDCQSCEISGHSLYNYSYKNAKMKDSYPLNINDLTINSENCVKFLGIEIDNKLSFEQHISTLCTKVSKQLKCHWKNTKICGF